MVGRPGKYKIPALAIALGSLLIGGFLYVLNYRQAVALPEELFFAPGRDYPSEKKVEWYFIEHLRMPPEEAESIRVKPGVDGKVTFRVSSDTRLDAVISNLHYYGFIKNEKAFRYALAHTKDTTLGQENALVVGKNSIDVNANYRISEDMSAWELAAVLLNEPEHFPFDEYRYLFMP